MIAQAVEPGESEVVCRAVARSRRGDVEALHFLYVRYAADVFSHALDVVADDRRAGQVTERIFSTLITRMQTYEQRHGPFGPWLLGLVDSVAREGASDEPAQAAEA